jgi:hypothetical protein
MIGPGQQGVIPIFDPATTPALVMGKLSPPPGRSSRILVYSLKGPFPKFSLPGSLSLASPRAEAGLNVCHQATMVEAGNQRKGDSHV